MDDDRTIIDAEFEVIEGPLRIVRYEPSREPSWLDEWAHRQAVALRAWWAPYRAWLFLLLIVYFAALALLRPWLLVHFGLPTAHP